MVCTTVSPRKLQLPIFQHCNIFVCWWGAILIGQYIFLALSVCGPQMAWKCVHACVCVCVCMHVCTGILQNGLICGHASVVDTSNLFHTHTHTQIHTHTHRCKRAHLHTCILIPSDDHEPTKLKVDIVFNCWWWNGLARHHDDSYTVSHLIR